LKDLQHRKQRTRTAPPVCPPKISIGTLPVAVVPVDSESESALCQWHCMRPGPAAPSLPVVPVALTATGTTASGSGGGGPWQPAGGGDNSESESDSAESADSATRSRSATGSGAAHWHCDWQWRCWPASLPLALVAGPPALRRRIRRVPRGLRGVRGGTGSDWDSKGSATATVALWQWYYSATRYPSE
jgi:hypothetical protein